MSMETRSSSALFKRAEQLKRWEESDTNRESASPKGKPRKVKFSSGCVFLAACAAGDKDEVLRLLEKGADINTTNVDGLTALHQACIDDNLDMVEFLVENGADVNRGDNEGWTPLHATASCGFLSIAKYLLENGANVAAVNNDGELPIDIAECEDMEDLLQAEIEEQGIDCNSARLEEERLMLKDARDWMAAKSPQIDMAHSKTGATPLHVASAKGYIKVMKLLLQCGADVDKQDVDGWTPLHAAAHWGQKEAAQLLAENLADMDCKNYVGQTPFDVADTDMFRFLDDLKKRQNKEEVLQRRQAKKRAEMQDKVETETPSKVKKVEVAIEEGVKNNNNNNNNNNGGVGDDVEKKNMVNSLNKQKDNNIIASNNTEVPKRPSSATPSPPAVPPKPLQGGDATAPPSTDDNNVPKWRKPPPSKPPVVTKVDSHATTKTASFKDKSTSDVNNENEVSLRRTNSFQNDPEFYTRYQALRARIQASSDPTHYSFPYDSQSKYIIAPSNKNRQQNRHQDKEETVSVSSTSTVNSVTTSTSSTPTNTSLSPTTSPVPNSQPVRSGLKLPVGANAPAAVASTANTNTSAISPSSGGNRLTVIKNFFKYALSC
ncbi:protein phosphatase 1 regulatory subunit 12A isoform X2 [Agrilus planipennis]|uniref:Protein phosphatase 1 regulatory subunit 12B n=1 Tax=Agrilus planipennis TaxID=224129 RepID=A0A7F5RLL2_AGRPL|nr:protein phosphatase 1 regulatory subunit 12A isoform X2 [Agrilus planipennis]